MLHRFTEKDNQILCLDYNRDGSYFATAGKDRTVINNKEFSFLKIM